MLDVAAGTGHVARRLAPRVRTVVALDATKAMLEQGREHAPPNVLFVQGDAAELPFLDDSFDVVVTRFAIHHFDDPRIQLAEMRRVLRPGGRLAVADLVAHPEAAATQNRLETLRDPSHARMLELDELAALVETHDVEVRDVVRPLEPWLVQTDPAPEAADEIRAALQSKNWRAARRPASGRPCATASCTSCTRWRRSSLQERPDAGAELVAAVDLAHEVVAVRHRPQPPQRLLGRPQRRPGVIEAS